MHVWMLLYVRAWLTPPEFYPLANNCSLLLIDAFLSSGMFLFFAFSLQKQVGCFLSNEKGKKDFSWFLYSEGVLAVAVAVVIANNSHIFVWIFIKFYPQNFLWCMHFIQSFTNYLKIYDVIFVCGISTRNNVGWTPKIIYKINNGNAVHQIITGSNLSKGRALVNIA